MKCHKTPIKPILLSLAVVSILAGCSNVRLPEQNLNERLEYTENIAERYQIDHQWWLVYQDAQLNQLVQRALDNNIDLAQSAINVNKALYQAKLIEADLVPSFSGSTSASTQKNLKTSASATRSFGGELGLSYELDLWQRLADSADARQWEYKATLEDKETARLVLVNNVVDAYYHLAYLKGAVTATELTISRYQKIQNLTRLKYQVGKVDSHQYTQASQSLLAAQNNLLDLHSQQKTTEQTLRDLLNLKPTDPLTIRYPNLLKVSHPKVDLNVPLSVLANRPDLRAAQFRLQKAFKSTQATEKSWYPSVTLGASLSSSSRHADSAFSVPFTSGNVRLNLPFLQWNTVKWNVKISEADYDSSLLNFEKNLTTALNEVDTYYKNYQNTRLIVDNITKKYNLDVKSTKYYQVRYQHGANELTDWLNALNTENSSSLSVLNNRYQLIRYENMIYKSMAGRYIQPPVNTTLGVNQNN